MNEHGPRKVYDSLDQDQIDRLVLAFVEVDETSDTGAEAKLGLVRLFNRVYYMGQAHERRRAGPPTTADLDVEH